MNKDVIYIETEDDITDVVAKVENSKEKILALVPPKKPGVLHSVVNIKLIAKASAAAGKTVVIVTTDPAIVKIAAAVHIPVTKNLQTAPVIPTAPKNASITAKETVAPKTESDAKKVDVEAADSEELQAKSDDFINPEAKEDEISSNFVSDEVEDDTPKSKPKKIKATHPKSGFAAWLQENKKIIIIASSVVGVLTIFFVWALVLAPGATITVPITTTKQNLSENVTLVTKSSEEKPEENKLYAELKKVENTTKTSFQATGTKNVGDVATGKIDVVVYFEVSRGKGSVPISADTTFSFNNLNYKPTSATTVTWSGVINDCENKESIITSLMSTKTSCEYHTQIDAVAIEAGEQYNVEGATAGWSSSLSAISVYSTTGFSGGTTKNITVVQQSDIDKAKENLKSSDESKMKEKLSDLMNEDYDFPIESSFKLTTSDVKSEPALGEEVAEGVTPTLSVTTTATEYVLQNTSVKTLIESKAKLSDGQSIYSIGEPFIENLELDEEPYTGRLKTTYKIGPQISEEIVLEKTKGKKIGEAQATLNSITGVKNAKVEGSFFWVSSVPDDPNKITIQIIEEE